MATGARLVLLTILLGLALFLSLWAGSVRLEPRTIFRVVVADLRDDVAPEDRTKRTIIVDLRLSRSILAAVVGAALALAGAAFQGLFRNPLADPFVIGASSGAALGAAVAIALDVVIPIAGLSSVPAAAFAGSLGSVFLVYGLSTAGTSRPPTVAMLLAGSALGSLFSSLVSFIMAVRDSQLHQIFFWLLGGFGGRTWADLSSIAPYVVPGVVVLFLLARPLDILAFGEESAQSMGVSVGLTRILTIAAASLVTAAAVAVSGIIGFVGLLAPHAARLMFGPSHRIVFPAAALLGAVILIFADMLARTVLAPVELPVGVLTAMLGAPFFLFLLRRRRERLGGLS